MSLNDTFTSTGHKFFAHQEAMAKLRNGKGQPIVTHVMLTDRCQHTCAFCSVQARAGDSLDSGDVEKYLDILQRYGLKSCVLSGGGNPILYKCKRTGRNFNDVVDMIHSRGLEIGLITNGMPLRKFTVTISETSFPTDHGGASISTEYGVRESWATVRPETLDKLTWIRISMAGLDHAENEVYVPDIDPEKTTLGFSYVAHDIYEAPEDPHHGKVSTEADLLSLGVSSVQGRSVRRWEDRIGELTEAIGDYVRGYRPKYIRLLPNCLEPPLIAERCRQLEEMAAKINASVAGDSNGYSPCFVQFKPPAAPNKCFLGYIHPVLNSDGYVLPCDSACLNESAGHKLGEPWRICHWKDIASIYEQPVRSLIKNPKTLCPGCVFTKSNLLLEKVVDGSIDLISPTGPIEHVNFV